MTSRRITSLLAVCCILAVPLRAAAGDPQAQAAQKDAEPEDQASRLMSGGNKAFREGRFAEAEQAYREAFTLKQGYDIAGNLGAAELALGKTREAAQHFAFTLRNFPITGEPALREQMQKAFDQAKKDLAVLRIQVQPSGAAVFVDSARVDEATLLDGVFVEPGEHEISAGCDGCIAEQRRVSAQKGATVEVTLTLEIVHNVLRRPEEPPAPPPKHSIVPGLVLGGVAAFGLVGGGVFMGLSASRKSEAMSLRTAVLHGQGSCVAGADNFDMTRCPELQGKLQSDDTLHNAAVGSFVAGGVAAAGAALYFLLPKLRVTPIAGARSGGAMVSGSF